jgi:hypothetical protein
VGSRLALIEQVEAWLVIVGLNPFPDGLPERFDGLEGLDVERRVWRNEGQIICRVWRRAQAASFPNCIRLFGPDGGLIGGGKPLQEAGAGFLPKDNERTRRSCGIDHAHPLR